MSKLLISLTVAPIAAVAFASFTPAISQETDVCDPLGRLISGLEVDEGSELLCSGETLPTANEDTTVTAICFTSNTVEEMALEAGESVAVAELCRQTHSVVECGDGICFSPRGEVAPITISVEGAPHMTVLDWTDIPGSHRYVIQVFDGPDAIFTAQPEASRIVANLALGGDETVSVTALSSERLIVGYGSFSTADENEGRPVSWMVEE